MTSTLRHEPTGATLATHVHVARTFRERARGWIGTRPSHGDALIMETPQVHTFFMKATIDVVFCDRDWRVLHAAHSMVPNRVSKWVRGARYVVELPAGIAKDVAVGDRLALV